MGTIQLEETTPGGSKSVYSRDVFYAYESDRGAVLEQIKTVGDLIATISEVGEETNFDHLSSLLANRRPGKAFVSDLERPTESGLVKPRETNEGD